MFKKFASLCVCLTVLFGVMPMVVGAAQLTSMVGTYIQFGQYQGENVIYRVIGEEDINNDGTKELMLCSEKVLTYKAYDSKGYKGTFVKWWDQGAYDNMVKKGSARWDRSAIRSWLNSSDEVVDYGAFSERPSSTFVTTNPYDTEKGFMGNMTIAEQSLIVPVTHRSLVSDIDFPRDDASAEEKALYGGTKSATSVLGGIAFNEYINLDQALNEYDNVYYQTTTDKVFLLSLKEFKNGNFVDANGTSHRTGVPTPQAANLSDTPNRVLTRDAFGSTELRHIKEEDQVGWYGGACDGNKGVRPAMYIKGGLSYTGKGTMGEPYIVDKKISKLIEFGNYNGKPVLYRIADEKDVNGDGKNELMIVAENILTYKAYDSNGWDGVAHYPTDLNVAGVMAEKGSGRWDRSAIRSWLNSNEDVVTYMPNSVAPSKDHVLNNPYDTESGFISKNNMTAIETNAIVPVTHTSIMTDIDFPDPTKPENAEELKLFGGTQGASVGLNDPFGQNKTIDELNAKYDLVFNKKTTDKVFLLSIKDLATINLKDEKGASHIATTSIDKTSANDGNRYLLRDAYGAVGNRYVNAEGTINYGEVPRDGKTGIRPAMFISKSLSLVGDGTTANPYKVRDLVVNSVSIVNNAADVEITVDAISSKGMNLDVYIAFYNGDKLVRCDIQNVTVNQSPLKVSTSKVASSTKVKVLLLDKELSPMYTVTSSPQ